MRFDYFSITKRLLASFLFTGFLFASVICCADQLSPVGVWKTVDDETGKARSIVQISEENGKLQGKIQKVFYRPGEGPQDVCKKCTGVFHNQLILGMTFLWGMEKEKGKENVWGNGRILDPNNGKIYRCQLTLSPDGKKLAVRGYLGVLLLGRTQHWYRVS